jgi:hypothetical protein
MRKSPAVQSLALAAIAVAALAITQSNGYATAIPIVPANGGAVLNIGNMSGTVVGVSNACINWAGGITCSTTTAEPMSVSGSDSTVFSVPSAGTIDNLPAGFTTPLVDFETVSGGTLGNGTVNFDLISIVNPTSQGFTPCVTPPGTEPTTCSTGTFLLTQNSSNQVSLSFTVTMEAYTGTSGTSYNAATLYNGLFTTQLSGTLDSTDSAGACTGDSVTISNLLTCEAAGGTVKATWSATESPVTGVPEPVPPALLGSGLLALSWFGRRRFSRS